LAKDNKINEAKGIFIRNGLKVSDFNKIVNGKNKVGADIDKHKYVKEKDWKPVEDLFEPVSSPHKDYFPLPVDIKYDFIDTEELVNKLRVLQGQKYIGVDSEWRPQVTRWHEVLGPATFQISGYADSFIIDILALKNSKKLDNMLSSIFQNPKTTVLGFGFTADIAVFNKYC